MKTAIITGICGQGGAYLAKLLLDKGYTVVGTTRDLRYADTYRLVHLGIHLRVSLRAIDLSELDRVEDLVDDVQPDEIYHMAGPSAVMRSFSEPKQTIDGIIPPILNLLETIRKLNPEIRLFNAGSCEVYGNTLSPAIETTPIQPVSPYGVAKATSHCLVRNYREAYGLFATTGIFFNYESPLRSSVFVTKKVVSHATRISNGEDDLILELGNLWVKRDWGWAPDYMEAAHQLLQHEYAMDVNIATGVINPLEVFVQKVFESLNLDYKDHTFINDALFRPLDIEYSVANTDAARDVEAKAVIGNTVAVLVDSVASFCIAGKAVSVGIVTIGVELYQGRGFGIVAHRRAPTKDNA